MERLKNMSLKKSFFAISLSFLLVGIILSVITFIICIEVRGNIDTVNQIEIDLGGNYQNIDLQLSESPTDWRVNILSVLQIILPVLFVIIALVAAAIMFYQIKLKEPLAILQEGAKRIERQDLDFSIKKYADDELGELCVAFETMRIELLTNKRELWKQMEERKRLNAAFSHDLRNPVTVLKGSAKILQKGIEQGNLSSDNARDTVELIAQYAARIESYVEVMSSVQKLEEIKCTPKSVDWQVLVSELESSFLILSAGTGKQIEFTYQGNNRRIYIDKYIVQNTAENLISNAFRYAQSTVYVLLTLEDKQITLSVSDDGSGFSSIILNKGAEPFLRDNNTSEQKHFGMGLYVCRLLCEKHGGNLVLENTSQGAKATAVFEVLKS